MARRRAPALLLTILLAMTVLAGCRARARRDAATSTTTSTAPTTTTAAAFTGPGACSPARARPAGQSTEHISSGGLDRTYLLYVPAAYHGDRPVPVVFDFHGYGSNGLQQLFYGDFRPQADKDGFVIVAPDGQGSGGNRHWNFGADAASVATGAPAPAAGEADDVVLTLAILDHLESTMCIDAKRVYSAGMSDGGAMTAALACRASDRFAAFGPVAVVFYSPQCARARAVPIAAFMGTADPVVPFNGGTVSCCGHPTVPAAPTSMAGWATHNGCGASHDDTLSPQVVLRRWDGCRAGADVRFYMIQGGGHTWPGSAFTPAQLGLTTMEISASQTLWQFFAEHPLPS